MAKLKALILFIILLVGGLVIFNTDWLLNINNSVYVSPEVIFFEIIIVGSLIYYEVCKKNDKHEDN